MRSPIFITQHLQGSGHLSWVCYLLAAHSQHSENVHRKLLAVCYLHLG